MYAICNIIPLIFGNKKTIEFRIHTPTFDVNKIIPFIYLNTAIIDFVVKYQSNILKNSSFLNQRDLSYIIGDTYKGDLYESLIAYINTRKKFTNSFNRKGEVMYDESKIPNCAYIIDWSSNNKKLVNSTEDILNDIPQYKQSIIDNQYLQDLAKDYLAKSMKYEPLTPSDSIPKQNIIPKVPKQMNKGIVQQMKEKEEEQLNKIEGGTFSWINMSDLYDDSYYGKSVVYGTGGEKLQKKVIKKEQNNEEEDNLPW